jgi:hypothetical protein
MNKIVFPLELEMKGPQVGDLQDALQLFLDRRAILANIIEDARKEQSAALQREHAKENFGKTTNNLVSIFQEERRLDVRVKGAVDEATAGAMNDLLRQWGLLEQPARERPYVVSGQVKQNNGLPLKGATVRAFHILENDSDFIRLGEDTTDAEGRYTIRYEMPEGLENIRLCVRVFDSNGNQLIQSDLIRKAKPLEIVNLIVPSIEIAAFQVEGKIASRNSPGIGGLWVQIVDRAVGEVVQLGEKTKTDDNGAYRISFSDSDLRRRGKDRPDLQARVFAGEKLIGTSEVRYNASNRETLNILLEEDAITALRSEHETLTAALSIHFKGKLQDLKETDDQPDIAYLANKTGWDARAVALASLASQFSAKTADAGGVAGIEPAFFYALFRAGLPTNETALYQIDPKAAENIWKMAITNGIIPATKADSIPPAAKKFQKLASEKLLTNPAQIGVSSLEELLSISIGGDDPDSRRKRKQFADLYTQHKSDLPKFWEEAEVAFGKEKVKRLKIDGKLSFLTLNNAPIIKKLHEEARKNLGDEGRNGIFDTRNLVEMGYYRANKWMELIVTEEIPQEIEGKDGEERKQKYSELLAAQTRLSHPTFVAAQVFSPNGELEIEGIEGLAEKVSNFLAAHEDKFDICMQPVGQFIAQNPDLMNVEPEVVKEITRFQRVQQITPNLEAKIALLNEHVDSARAVLQYDRDAFAGKFKDKVGGEETARLIHSRAQQVHNAVLNIAVSYLTASIAPGIGVHSKPRYIFPWPEGITESGPQPAAHASDIIAYPTLESLFGEMDYCTCEHCRSILSPAAYLVNLLKFIDVKADSQGGELKEKNPLKILLDRRPDIEHLPLTCENTNIPIPYIDLVNEILEYYITNGLSLATYSGHTMDDRATPEELLANPQFAIDNAYTILSGEKTNNVDPLLPPTPPLPFHRSLEMLRRYFDKFEAPLQDLMEALSEDRKLDRADPKEYGWRDILMEELKISRPEYERFTKHKKDTSIPPKIDLIRTMKCLYGYEEKDKLDEILYSRKLDETYIPGLLNAKAFSRRVDISYEDLIEILKTRFVNPNSVLIPKLEKLGYNYLVPKLAKLGVGFDIIKDFVDNKIKKEDFEKKLTAGLDKSLYGGDVAQWVKDNYKLISANTGVNFQIIFNFHAKYINDLESGKNYIKDLLPLHEIDITQFGGKTGLSDDEKLSKIAEWLHLNYDRIMSLVLLTDPTNSGDIFGFDKLEMRYTNPGIDQRMSKEEKANRYCFELIRLIRFIRLWKKLGWTIEQTDKAISALYPTDKIPDEDTSSNLLKLDEGFLILLPRLGMVKRIMDDLNLKPKKDLLSLLACFAPIDSYGTSSLYRQMFLSRAILAQDDVFAEDGNGNILQKIHVGYTHPQPKLEQPILDAANGKMDYDPINKRLLYTGVLTFQDSDAIIKAVPGIGQAFKDAVAALHKAQRLNFHSEALRAAFGLTAEEFSEIIMGSGFDKYIFGWNEIPGNDSTRLMEFLSQKFLIDWVKKAKFEKIDNGKTIKASAENKSILLKLDDKNTEVILEIDNVRTNKFTAKIEEGKLNIYDESTPLTLENISAIFRQGWLARKLKLSVREFLLLTKSAGFDPFELKDPADLPIQRLIDLVRRLRAVSLKPTQALYLIWNQDISGKSTPSDSEILEFARTLRSAFAAIDSEFSLVDDPDGKIAHDRMALVYGNEATEFFFGLLGNTIITSAPYVHSNAKLATVTPYSRGPVNLLTRVYYSHHQANLEDDIVNAANGHIKYDNTKKQLSFDDTLTEAIRSALKATNIPGVSDEFKAAVDNLYDENQKIIKANLEQDTVDISPDLIYENVNKQLSFTGTFTASTRDALKAIPIVSDEFKAAVDSLYLKNQIVIKANLEQPIALTAPGLISYDDFLKQISFAGVLSTEIADGIKDAAKKVLSVGEIKDFETAIDNLSKKNQEIVIGPFFAKYPILKTLYEAYYFFGQLSSSATYNHNQATLDKQILEIAQGKLSYDPNSKQLSCSGVLSKELCELLKDVQNVSEEFKGAIQKVYEKSQDNIDNFLENHKDLTDLKDAYLAADNIPVKMRSVLLASFLPELKDRRKSQQALQAISSSAKTDIAFASSIMDGLLDESKLGDKLRKYILHAAANNNEPAIKDLKATEKRGLFTQFYFKDTAIGQADEKRDAEEKLDYSSTGTNKLPASPAPGGILSGIWSGYLEAPENGYYNFYIQTDASATAIKLEIGESSISMQSIGNGTKVWSNQTPIELRAGKLYYFSINAENLKDRLSVLWEIKGRGPREIIPSRYLYSATIMNHLRHTYIRFLKAASLSMALKLTTAEVAYLFSDAKYRIDGEEGEGWLNSLPVLGDLDKALIACILKAFGAMLDFARIKAELSPDDEGLLTVIKNPEAQTQDKKSMLLSLTRWEEASLDALLGRFSKNHADLKDLSTFCRIYDAYSWVKKLGIPAFALITAATNDPSPDTIRQFQGALRARYEENDWLSVIRPINDEMRGLQRDALVAYILHQMRSNDDTAHIDTPEKLFEYFLMDVEMEPCMQTSRVRHALSSVQLFIERCLMNLETEVPSSLINAKQWEWMKRYRVWEANRKVFLYPENWLEPELRDDQSPFFKEAISELLQGDITEDRAAEVLLNYLSKLEEVAKLEPIGMCVEKKMIENQEVDFVHVIARTAGANRKYYYRRCEGISWTPWEPIKLDIEDNPVIPVIWRDRLFLFWLRLLKQAPLDPNNISTSTVVRDQGETTEYKPNLASCSLEEIKTTAQQDARNVKITIQAILCYSEYYNGKWQSTKTSDLNMPVELGRFDPSGANAFNRSLLGISSLGENNKLFIQIYGQGISSSFFTLYNTHSLPIRTANAIAPKPVANVRIMDTSSDLFAIRYEEGKTYFIVELVTQSGTPTGSTKSILKNPIIDRTIQPHHILLNPWEAPFFYDDSRHVFYVTNSISTITSPYWDEFHIAAIPNDIIKEIPPVILAVQDPRPLHIPDPYEQIIRGSIFGADPFPIKHFLSEDAFIKRGIGIVGPVQFGDKEIGLRGSIKKSMVKQ